MSRPPVRLSPEARELAADAVVSTFERHAIQMIALAIDDHHAHLLARFEDDRPRHWVGLAKKHSARAITDAGIVPRGKVWAVRSHAQPVRDRDHQVTAYRYILAHANRDATTRTPKTQGPESLGF